MAESSLQSQDDVDKLEREMERLRVLYHHYFQGQAKREPLVLRKQLHRLVLQANPRTVHNTGLRFRINGLIQRWNTHLTYWNRISRQIEEGTYVRDLDRARRRNVSRDRGEAPPRGQDEAAGAGVTSHDVAGLDLQQELDTAIAHELAAATRAVESRAQPPAPAAGGPGKAKPAEALFQELVLARQRRGETLEGLSFDTVVQAVSAQEKSGKAPLRVVEDDSGVRLVAGSDEGAGD